MHGQFLVALAVLIGLALFAHAAALLFSLLFLLVIEDRLILGHDRVGDHRVGFDAEILGVFLAIDGQYDTVGAGADRGRSAEAPPASAGESSPTFAAAARSAFGRARG